MKKQKIAAIDIGTTKIVCIFGERDEKGIFSIKAMDSIPSSVNNDNIIRGSVINVQKTTENIKKVVQAVKEKVGEDFKEVFVGIAGDHIRTMKSSEYLNLGESRLITKEDIALLEENIRKIRLPNDGDKILEVIPQDYKVDENTGIKDPVGMLGEMVEGNFHIVTGRVQSINTINKCVKNAGLEIKRLILEPLASAYATLTEEEKEGGVLMIDIGGGTSDIVVYKNFKIMDTAIIPFGGVSVTKDLEKILKILNRQAEEIKTKHASCLPSMEKTDVIKVQGIEGRKEKVFSLKEIAFIINARIIEIFKFINIELKEANIDLEEIGIGIVLTGGGAQLKYIDRLLERFFGKEVRIGYPKVKGADIVNKPQYATAVGLIMAGSSYLDENIQETENEGKTENEEKKEPGFLAKIAGLITEAVVGSKEDMKIN